MFDFSKVHTEPINAAFVLKRVSDAQIFWHYYGEFDLGKVYSSIFRKDRKPSVGFFIGKSGEIVYNDFSTGENLNCFAFVAKLFNVSYGDAIRRVAADFGLIDGRSATVDFSRLRAADSLDREAKRETIIQITPGKWNESNLLFWREFEITKDELVANDVYPVKSLFINKAKITNPKKYNRYAYLQRDKEGKEYLKIYSPQDSRMKWVSNIPLNLPFGIDTLPKKSDTLIVTKSQKDRIVLKKIFSDVVATQNESESSVPDWFVEQSANDYKTRIIFWDNDPTGVENCKKFNEKGFGYFNIPRSYYERWKIKDASDFVAFYGVDALVDLLKEKGIVCFHA